MPNIKILLTGGGSGGHVYPFLAVAEALQKIAAEKGATASLSYLGPKDEYAEALKPAGIKVRGIVSAKFRRYGSIQNLLDVPKFAIGLVEALIKIFFMMPDAIFSKGGTGALPVILAGWFYRIPIIIHESDATPGLTNKISARFAARIAVSFEKALDYFDTKKTALTGTPVRSNLLQNLPAQASAKETIGFDPQKPLTLIVGGSQGSQRINEFIVTNLPAIIKETQILHQTGVGNYVQIEMLSRAALGGLAPRAGEKKIYFPAPYFGDDYKTALAAADLVVSRAGSGTISEIAAFGKPSILIPLEESANDHQRANAYEFSKTGAAVTIEESNLLPAVFINQIRSLLNHAEATQKMSAAARAFFKPDASEVIAREILGLAGS